MTRAKQYLPRPALRRPAKEGPAMASEQNGTRGLMSVGMMSVGLISLALGVAPNFAQPAAHAQQTLQTLRLDAAGSAGEFIAPLNKSQVLQVNRAFAEIAIGNPEIADVVALTNSSLYVLGLQHGTTNLSLIDAQGGVIAVLDVVVTHDLQTLKSKLHDVLPGERIEVRSAGSAIVLSGQVSSPAVVRQAMALAQHYAPDNVTNMLTVGGSQQVLLQVRFAEVQRSTMKELGANLSVIGIDGGDSYSIAAGDGSGAQSFVSTAASVVSGSFQVDALIDALEQKGMVRTLSEPNIIALSGDSASFLAGGEFPIPVSQSGGANGSAVTVEFKPFGVGLDFTPTVLGAETVNLELATEVSSIDTSVSVTTDGITIPGLKVRRASTTVEMKDGQSFAIAGLIQDNFQDSVRQVPGFADLPILGALARSSAYERNQTELVIFITVRLVEPAHPEMIRDPLGSALPPTEFELFLLGRTEGRPSVTAAAGIRGEYGYILP